MHCLLLILLILNISNSLDDAAYLRKEEIYSQNGKYCIKLSGLYNDGFSRTTYTLVNTNNNDTLWVKKIPEKYLLFPCVSNIGDVAISSGSKVQIFDCNDSLKGTKQGEICFNPNPFAGYAAQSFSLSGGNYFFFSKYGNEENAELGLVCLNDSAKEIWRDSIGFYKPTEIIVYQDKLVIHYSDDSIGPNTYCCHILNMVGQRVFQYTRKYRGDWNVQFDGKSGILFIIDGKSKQTIDVNKFAAP